MVQSLQSIENTSQATLTEVTTVSSISIDELKTDDNPNNLPYYEESVLTHYRSRNYRKCIKNIEKILKVTPKEEAAHYKILQGACYTMLSDFKKAHAILQNVLKRNPKDSYALYNKATAYYFQGDFDRSLELLDRAIELNDTSEMERAKNLKIRVEIERKKLKIVLEKIDININNSDDEFDVKNIKKEVENEEFKSPKSRNHSKCKKSQKSTVDSLMLRQNNLIAKIKRKSLIKNEDAVFGDLDEIEGENLNGKYESKDEKLMNGENCENSDLQNNISSKNDQRLIKRLINGSTLDLLKSENSNNSSLNHSNNLSTNFESTGPRNKTFDQTMDEPMDIDEELSNPEAFYSARILESEINGPNGDLNSETGASKQSLENGVKKLILTSGPNEQKSSNLIDQNLNSKTQSSESKLNNSQNIHSSSSKPERPRRSQKIDSRKSQNLKSGLNRRPDSVTNSTGSKLENDQNQENSNICAGSNLTPKISSNSPAQESFNRGLDLYMAGNLRKSLKHFEKSLKLEPDFEEADEMGTKVQELLELMDLAEMNLSQKNYENVVEIITQALDVDDDNDNVNKILYFKRGLAYFHMKENENSLKDYAEFERLKKKLGE
jgi:tetratricopeptide (TPR) repeat protein